MPDMHLDIYSIAKMQPEIYIPQKALKSETPCPHTELLDCRSARRLLH